MGQQRQLTTLQLFTLACLLRFPMHAYAVRQEIIYLSGHEHWPAQSSIQSVLLRLEELGYVEAHTNNPNYWLVARRGMPYKITPAGRLQAEHALIAQTRMLRKIQDRLKMQAGYDRNDFATRQFIDEDLPATGMELPFSEA